MNKERVCINIIIVIIIIGWRQQLFGFIAAVYLFFFFIFNLFLIDNSRRLHFILCPSLFVALCLMEGPWAFLSFSALFSFRFPLSHTLPLLFLCNNLSSLLHSLNSCQTPISAGACVTDSFFLFYRSFYHFVLSFCFSFCWIPSVFVSFSDRMCAFCVLSLYFLFIYLFSVSQIFIYLPWLALVFILLLLVFIFAKKEIILEGLVCVCVDLF